MHKMVRLEISIILKSKTKKKQAYVRASGAGWYFNTAYFNREGYKLYPKIMPSDVATLSTIYANRSVTVFLWQLYNL